VGAVKCVLQHFGPKKRLLGTLYPAGPAVFSWPSTC